VSHVDNFDWTSGLVVMMDGSINTWRKVDGDIVWDVPVPVTNSVIPRYPNHGRMIAHRRHRIMDSIKSLFEHLIDRVQSTSDSEAAQNQQIGKLQDAQTQFEADIDDKIKAEVEAQLAALNSGTPAGSTGVTFATEADLTALEDRVADLETSITDKSSVITSDQPPVSTGTDTSGATTTSTGSSTVMVDPSAPATVPTGQLSEVPTGGGPSISTAQNPETAEALGTDLTPDHGTVATGTGTA
jgi:hypothetical protein